MHKLKRQSAIVLSALTLATSLSNIKAIDEEFVIVDHENPGGDPVVLEFGDLDVVALEKGLGTGPIHDKRKQAPAAFLKLCVASKGRRTYSTIVMNLARTVKKAGRHETTKFMTIATLIDSMLKGGSTFEEVHALFFGVKVKNAYPPSRRTRRLMRQPKSSCRGRCGYQHKD